MRARTRPQPLAVPPHAPPPPPPSSFRAAPPSPPACRTAAPLAPPLPGRRPRLSSCSARATPCARKHKLARSRLPAPPPQRPHVKEQGVERGARPCRSRCGAPADRAPASAAFRREFCIFDFYFNCLLNCRIQLDRHVPLICLCGPLSIDRPRRILILIYLFFIAAPGGARPPTQTGLKFFACFREG